jgi:hypothetical protein
MSTLELNALIGSNPLGALAAFGLLRVLSRQGGSPRLSFVERDDWVARIECEHASVEALIGALTIWTQSRREAVLSWTSGDVRVNPKEYRTALIEALSRDDDVAPFLSALAADGAVDKSKGLIKPTTFYIAKASSPSSAKRPTGPGERHSLARGATLLRYGELVGTRARNGCMLSAIRRRQRTRPRAWLVRSG